MTSFQQPSADIQGSTVNVGIAANPVSGWQYAIGPVVCDRQYRLVLWDDPQDFKLSRYDALA